MENNEQLFKELSALKNMPENLRAELTEPEQETSQPENAGNITGDLSHITAHTTNEAIYSPVGDLGTQGGQQMNAATGSTPQAQTLNVGQFLKPDLIIEFGDKVLPALLVLGLSYLDKKRKYSKDAFYATKDEKKMLEPLVDAFLKSINFKVENPANALLIGIACIYGTKIIDARADALPRNTKARDYEPLTGGFVPSMDAVAPVKRGKGRPKGSTKNKME